VKDRGGVGERLCQSQKKEEERTQTREKWYTQGRRGRYRRVRVDKRSHEIVGVQGREKIKMVKKKYKMALENDTYERISPFRKHWEKASLGIRHQGWVDWGGRREKTRGECCTTHIVKKNPNSSKEDGDYYVS